jgi:pyruvate carboxylase
VTGPLDCVAVLEGVPFHSHDTRNTGYATAVAAVQAGVHVLDAGLDPPALLGRAGGSPQRGARAR